MVITCKSCLTLYDAADQSRLQSAQNNFQILQEDFSSAAFQILDADMAMESGQYLRLQIIQNLASSILDQANQLPQIVLDLLRE